MECIGDNTVYGVSSESGNTHDRVAATTGINGGVHPPDLGTATNPNHDPINENPIIFSVDRGTYGATGSAVDVQVAVHERGVICATVRHWWALAHPRIGRENYYCLKDLPEGGAR